VVAFHPMIEPLTNPTAHGGDASDAFHVVCPSLPGYGFSGKPARAGWGIDRIAAAWAVLMDRLGYSRYGAQGGDWGADVTMSLAAQDSEHCTGIHITDVLGCTGIGIKLSVDGNPSPEEARALQGSKYFNDWDSGYTEEQSTRPQTLGYALTDSPAGQAAWILEKFWAWSDCGGQLENILSRDELLDHVMMYWVTASAASSARLYWESYTETLRSERRPSRPLTIPTGVAVFPKEIVAPVRRWMEEQFTDIRHWTEMPKGGHFAALEQPELFVRDVRTYFGLLRQ
jgi:epoxide hydrolase